MSKGKKSYMRVKKISCWVGSDGSKYPYPEYSNHGFGDMDGKPKDLPNELYPYTVEYKYASV